VLSLCERFKCLPSQLYREDVELLQLLEIRALGGGGPEPDVGDLL
jgi:hypothetical protein